MSPLIVGVVGVLWVYVVGAVDMSIGIFFGYQSIPRL